MADGSSDLAALFHTPEYAEFVIFLSYVNFSIKLDYAENSILLFYAIFVIINDRRHTMSLIARSPKQLGNIIQRTRKQRGLTQTDLANLSGLRQEKISKIESGQDGAKLSTIFALLAALNLEIAIEPRSGKAAKGIGDIF